MIRKIQASLAQSSADVVLAIELWAIFITYCPSAYGTDVAPLTHDEVAKSHEQNGLIWRRFKATK
jgi:hypothetical protein